MIYASALPRRAGAQPVLRTRIFCMDAIGSSNRGLQSPSYLQLQREPQQAVHPCGSLGEHAIDRAAFSCQLDVQPGVSRRQHDELLKGMKELTSQHKRLMEEVVMMRAEMSNTDKKPNAVAMGKRLRGGAVRGRSKQSPLAYKAPTLEYAAQQPRHVSELSHENLAVLAMENNQCAQRERLLREIMAVEGISWGDAHEKLAKLGEAKAKLYWVETLPYRIGIFGAMIGGVMGTLLVFNKPIAQMYAEKIAGEELPEGVKDISELTMNQVGAWTWNWMEPMIGVASFVLLCCQFSKGQARQIHMRTYGECILHWRANRLAQMFPQYDKSMVRAWSMHMPRTGLNFSPIFERDIGMKGATSGL